MALNITSKEFGRRFRKALSVPFLLNQVCPTNTQEFVTSYSASLGCTEKSFFFPLLSCAASCMGTECYVELTSLWQEPPIVWTLVVTPRSLQRIDVAEHIKQKLLEAQTEAYVIEKSEDTKEYLKKFVFDMFTFGQLHDMLKLSNGHGLALYNSVRSLHKNMLSVEDADIMLRLHYGLAWFGDSRSHRTTITKTRVNFAVISSPTQVHNALTSAANFPELFYQCFLTTCSEENHVKFAQITEISEASQLKEVFLALLKLHCNDGPMGYKLSAEAKEKFSQIHDELTDKAKQMARKNAHKVFQPALSYLARLSCVLHVLDSALDAINYKIPISRLTWNTEISASTVWNARELLGHIIEQRHALMEQTMIEVAQKPVQPTAINLVDPQRSPIMTPIHNSPRIMNVNRTAVTPTGNHRSPVQGSPRFLLNNTSSFSMNNARRNIMNNRIRSPVNQTFVPLPNQNKAPTVAPIITSVSSAGLPVGNDAPAFNPVISSIEPATSNNLNTELNLPKSLSVSVSEDMDSSRPVLLSRSPFASVLEISEEDFLSNHRSSIKKLLKHSVSEISPSRCVQLKLIADPTASDEAQKYSLSFARSFLKRLESLGFGLCDGPKNGNIRNFVFKKKKFSALGDEQKQILNELKISEVEYNKCFTTVPARDQNGSVVCLE